MVSFMSRAHRRQHDLISLVSFYPKGIRIEIRRGLRRGKELEKRREDDRRREEYYRKTGGESSREQERESRVRRV
jgi:hypothetical protein